MNAPTARRSPNWKLFSASGALALLWAFSCSPSSLAQGPLTPPGAPAPTMKSLDQIEARTPVSSAPFTISSSGSYYLTKNLTVASGDAITVSADEVTLDLNGFAISSTANPATGVGITMTGIRNNVTIRNGSIRGSVTNSGGTYSGSGFAFGVRAAFAAFNIRISDLSVLGCTSGGIILQKDGTVVERCIVRTIGGIGINAENVSNSIVRDCGGDAISAFVVRDSTGETSGNATGIIADTANNCRGSSLGSGTGILAANASNCHGSSGSSGAGMNVTRAASNCSGVSVSGPGVNVVGTATGCHGVSSVGSGLSVRGSATGCVGTSASGDGLLLVKGAVSGCFGESTNLLGFGGGLRFAGDSTGDAATAINSVGIAANDRPGLEVTSATNCYGQSGDGDGLVATNAINCSGQSRGGSGAAALRVFGVALSCRGKAINNGATGISAYIGNSCRGTAAFGPPEAIEFRYNMPPP